MFSFQVRVFARSSIDIAPPRTVNSPTLGRSGPRETGSGPGLRRAARLVELPPMLRVRPSGMRMPTTLATGSGAEGSGALLLPPLQPVERHGHHGGGARDGGAVPPCRGAAAAAARGGSLLRRPAGCGPGCGGAATPAVARCSAAAAAKGRRQPPAAPPRPGRWRTPRVAPAPHCPPPGSGRCRRPPRREPPCRRPPQTTGRRAAAAAAAAAAAGRHRPRHARALAEALCGRPGKAVRGAAAARGVASSTRASR